MNCLERRKARWSVVASVFVGIVATSQELIGGAFTPLGDLPGGAFESGAIGVSDDGLVVTGSSRTGNGFEAFRWDPVNGMVGLGDLLGGSIHSFGADISNDGNVIGGHSDSSSGTEAFRWDSVNGMVGLGDLPDGGFLSDVRDVNGDGSVLVGIGSSVNGFPEAFRWENGVMTPLGDLPGGAFSSDANNVSPDGQIVVGGSQSGNGQEAFRWDSVNGMVSLGDLPGGGVRSGAVGISANTLVIVGHAQNDDGNVAFRLENGVMESLGDLPGGRVEATGNSCNADGAVVVGSSHTGISDPFGFGFEAFIWDASNGMRNLKNVLETECGLDLSGWILSFAEDISSDGQFIVGGGFNPDGNFEAWLAELPGCPCDLLTVTSFAPPMGMTKKLKSTLPIKFQMFIDGVEITSQEQLDQILADNGCAPACPEIRIFEVGDAAGLPKVDINENVGDPDEGNCFRYSSPNWIYNLKLDKDVFKKDTCYQVEIGLGDCVLNPDNDIFDVK